MAFFSPSTWKGKSSQIGLPRCGECGLAKTCYSPKMPVTGLGQRSILFVSDTPGEQEDREGVQLVGKAGEVLRQVLHGSGEELDDCWKTNAVICHPPKGKAEDNNISACRPTLLKTINQLKPKVIILLGQIAIKSLISTEWKESPGPISQWAGWAIPSERYTAWLCPTYHPSFILSMKDDPTLRLLLKEHLQAAMSLEGVAPNPLDLECLKKEVEIIQNSRLARLRMRELATKKGLLAFDYETTGIKPDDKRQRIVTCAFCFEGEDTFAVPIDPSSYRTLSKILQTKKLKKIAANAKFEQRWTLAKLGHKVEGWWWDTMIASHILDNRRGITSLKFQAYAYFGIGDYDSHIAPFLKSKDNSDFNRVEEADQRDLLLYNGLDAILEYKVAMRQRELLQW